MWRPLVPTLEHSPDADRVIQLGKDQWNPPCSQDYSQAISSERDWVGKTAVRLLARSPLFTCVAKSVTPQRGSMSTGFLSIDLDAVAQNWKALDRLSAPSVETAATVKANGYGLGGVQVARALKNAGARSFFVASASEGAVVRKAIDEADRIFCYAGHMPGDTDLIAGHSIIPLLNSVEQLNRHMEALPNTKFGIQLDTGMNRLGFEPSDWAAVRETALQKNPLLLISHLACADEANHSMNEQQLSQFREMAYGDGIPLSLAATGGILLGPEFHFNLTRPGIGLYGGLPFRDACPVVTLSVPVVQTRRVTAGETVGYGNSWVADRNSLIATVAAGYADGLLRSLSNHATLFADGSPCPLVGRVSMDLVTVDITHLDKEPETLDLICGSQSVDGLADSANTIGYEILTSLGERYTRCYRGGP